MTNEQKYKTTDERMRAFWRFCKGQEKKRGCLGCPTGCVPTYREQCALAWLALEAEEEKLLPCPFCGGEAIGVHERYGFSEHCELCWAGTDVCNTKADAIAAWNRRVK